MLWQPFRSDGRVVLALWGLVQVVLLVQALAGGIWPWRMFAAPEIRPPVVIAEARVDDGAWQPLRIDDAFHYTRGWSERRVPDEAKALYEGRAHPRDRAAFARWLVAELAPDAGYTEVRLRLEREGPRGGPVESTGLGRFPVTP
ncbi:MAG: hypothetical protein ACI8PZ_000151 [Myxococcota bacterium]|jgi:hypothetical protein